MIEKLKLVHILSSTILSCINGETNICLDCDYEKKNWKGYDCGIAKAADVILDLLKENKDKEQN